jgi:hypothetical protein
MIGAKHEDDWYFYHDTLCHMTCHKMKAWMQETGIIRCWILPLNGPNGRTIYVRCLSGDSPEFMHLDTSLFNDVQHCVNMHVMITVALPKSDERKFSLATPNRVASTYIRI